MRSRQSVEFDEGEDDQDYEDRCVYIHVQLFECLAGLVGLRCVHIRTDSQGNKQGLLRQAWELYRLYVSRHSYRTCLKQQIRVKDLRLG